MSGPLGPSGSRHQHTNGPDPQAGQEDRPGKHSMHRTSYQDTQGDEPPPREIQPRDVSR